jgi:predicted RecB family nuclease
VLQERGLELERAYLAHLRAVGCQISEPNADDDSGGLARTMAAMRDGADVIYQAALRTGHWYGRADFLQRVDRPSRLGAWSYEVLDAKLARDTRAGTILQLCLYSHIVGEIQGDLPEQMHVILPSEDFQPLSFRVRDFLFTTGLCSGGSRLRWTAPPNLPPIRTPFPNAISAAGGQSAIDGATTMTISV